MCPISPSLVQVANGDFLSCQYVVPNFTWWIQGQTFSYDLKVVQSGGHDAILGMNWLAQWGDMSCNWATKTLKFFYQDQWIALQGVQESDSQTELCAISYPQILKWQKGCDIWAAVLLEPTDNADSQSISEVVAPLLSEFADVFQEPKCLPPHRTFDHAIFLYPDDAPVNSKPYRYSPLQKDEIECQVKDMIDSGLITPSMSPFSSPVLLVKKKDGTWRFCVDYRKLNSVTIKSKFPMPVVDELLDELAGKQYFSKLDLRAGYHQIRMVEQDEFKAAFKTHHGQFQFSVMPFGLTNAPSTFQCLMNSVFASLICKCVLVFMDDILVYNPNLDSHLHHLRQVFMLLRQHQLYAKMSKRSFACAQLEYLGHIISVKGVSTDAAKTAAMLAWPIPQTATELRGFLGLTGYYHKFVPNYSIIAKPLTVLLKKKAFLWSDAAQQAFQQLKLAMSSTPVLALPNFSLPFVLETDACAYGVGAVLSQLNHPIAYYSKALGPTNQKLSIYEKEFLAIMMAVDKWRCYLQRCPFTICTDHKSLCHLNDQVLGTDLQQKAMTKLMGFQYTFQYQKGVDNS